MRSYVRSAAFAAAVVLAVGVLGSRAADDKELKPAIQKIAAAFDKKDDAAAKKLAAETAKNTKDFEEVMHLFALRTKKGLGVGPKAGAIMPDGIEKKLEVIGDKGLPADKLTAEADALVEMGNIVASIGEISLAKKPAKDEGKKKVKDWEKWSVDLRDSGLAFAAAVKKKDTAALKKAADKANTSCTKCHDAFRYE